jgi:heat shock protein HslJ
MTTDLDARLRADGEHWRHAQPRPAPFPSTAALAAAGPESDPHVDATDVLELTGARPSPHPATHRRWVWAAAAAVAVLLVGTVAGVIGTIRRDAGPAAAAGLAGTSWVAPGTGTNGNGTTLAFDRTAKKLTISDGCTTSPYHVIVGRGTLQIGGLDGTVVTCSPPGLQLVPGDPRVAAQKALDPVLHGTVTWTIGNGTLTLGRDAKTATLFATSTIAQRCAATEVVVTAAGTAHQYLLGQQPRAISAKAPTDINATATGPCRAAVAISLTRADRRNPIQPSRYGQWPAAQPGLYQLSFTLTVCTPAHNDCRLGLHPLRVSVRVGP